MDGEPDAVMHLIGEGIAAGQQGPRERARSIFEAVWQRIGGDQGEPFHRCALAHSMADVQDDPRQELVWDLRALEAAEQLTDERARADGATGSVEAFSPESKVSSPTEIRPRAEASWPRCDLFRIDA